MLPLCPWWASVCQNLFLGSFWGLISKRIFTSNSKVLSSKKHRWIVFMRFQWKKFRDWILFFVFLRIVCPQLHLLACYPESCWEHTLCNWIAKVLTPIFVLFLTAFPYWYWEVRIQDMEKGVFIARAMLWWLNSFWQLLSTVVLPRSHFTKKVLLIHW